MTPASFTHHVFPILKHTSPDRLEKAVSGLVSGAYRVCITRQTATELSAFVTNGDGKQYGVTLAEGRAFCSCKDSMFRHTVCKHSAALALHVIRAPREEQPREEQRPVNLRLVKTRPAFVASA
jgi:uncharacterized Zn finger protein